MRRILGVLGCALALVVPAGPSQAGSSGTLVFSVFARSATKAGLHTMPGSGGADMKLAGTDTAYRPRWSPDGYGLAYIHARSIRWIDADGSNDHLLIGAAAMPTHHPIPSTIAWSPNGKQLLLSMYTTRFRTARLYRVPLATKRFHVVLKGSTGGDWSSSGRIAAVTSDALITLDPDGSNRTRILTTTCSGLAGRPTRRCWSSSAPSSGPARSS